MTVQQPSSRIHRQPWLHELSICVHGNATALSAADGQMEPVGAQGLFVDDRRVLSRLVVEVGGSQATAVADASVGAGAHFLAAARHLGDHGADPTVELHRRREVVDSGMVERLDVVSRAAQTVHTELVVLVCGDGADIGAVKAGGVVHRALVAQQVPCGVAWTDKRHATTVTSEPAPDRVLLSSLRTTAVGTDDASHRLRGVGRRVRSDDASHRLRGADTQVRSDGAGARLAFDLSIEPGATVTVTVSVDAGRTSSSALDCGAGADRVTWQEVMVEGDDPRLAPTLRTSLDDLQQLLLTDPKAPEDVFAAAGTPWYLTLFGRDSLWAARMMLPFGTRLAGGTLRALSRRQGREHYAASAQEPGKIPHELRRSTYVDPDHGLSLPPVYYGTIDATPLWMTLLHDAWRWGLPEQEVVDLLPSLQRAAAWLVDSAAASPDGLLRYLDVSGSGLANQGWKDSDDAVRWRDGRIADGPIALVEAQAYAVEAAAAAADVLDAFGLTGASELRSWAKQMRSQVSARFWLAGDLGTCGDRYLGLAVDGDGAAVDGVGSNMGHVLGTGTLDRAEVDLVARRLTSPELLGPYGVGTLARDNGGFNPIGYHTGSVWTHDTAICAWGLQREGHRDQAVTVARTLLASASAFHYRWPELYAGEGVLGRPAPYPASCRPQAWSAASAAVLLWVALGFEADAPAGRLTLRPTRPAAYGAFEVRGLQFAGHPLSLRVAGDGEVELLETPPGFDVHVE